MEAFSSIEVKETITLEEHRQVVKHLNEKDRITSWVLFDSGCRIGEIVRSIRQINIDEKRKVIWVENKKNACPRCRPAPVGNGTLSLLYNYIEKEDIRPECLIFPTSRSVFSKALQRALVKSGLDRDRNISVSTYYPDFDR